MNESEIVVHRGGGESSTGTLWNVLIDWAPGITKVALPGARCPGCSRVLIR